jgi:hypothetical protein
MLDEYETATAGFCFPAPAAQPLQEQADGNTMFLFGVPPMNANARLQPFMGQTHSLTSQVATSSKPQCSVLGCRRKPAIECGLCKGCCEHRGTGCSSTKHRSGPPRRKKAMSFIPERPAAASVAFSIETSGLAGPPSTEVHPPTAPITPMLEPHSFREAMPENGARSGAQGRRRLKKDELQRSFESGTNLRWHNRLSFTYGGRYARVPPMFLKSYLLS